MCFVHFSGLSRSGDQVLGECIVLVGPYTLKTSVVLIAQLPTVPGMLCVSFRVLISGYDTLDPGLCEPSRIPGSLGLQQATCSQFGGKLGLWGRDCSSPLPSASRCYTPPFLPLGGRVVDSSPFALLWYLPGCNSLFYECAKGHHASLEIFHGNDPFFLSLAIPWLGLLCHIKPFRLSSGHLIPVLTLRMNDTSHASTTSPHSLLVDMSFWATSPLVVEVKCIFCVFCCCCCLFLVMLPLRFQISLQVLPVRGSPIVWKLLLHDSFPRRGLCPKSFVSVFIFYILSYFLWRIWASFLAVWFPPPAFRSCFVEVAPHSNNLLMNLWKRKWSPHPIPPPSWDCSSLFYFVFFLVHLGVSLVLLDIFLFSGLLR